MSAWVVVIFSLLIIGFSGYGFVEPPGYLDFLRRFADGSGVWSGFAIRLALALLLWWAAPASATPRAFRVLAVSTAVGALVLPIVGRERLSRLVEWGARQPAWLRRGVCLLGLALGLFLLGSALAGLRGAGPGAVSPL